MIRGKKINNLVSYHFAVVAFSIILASIKEDLFGENEAQYKCSLCVSATRDSDRDARNGRKHLNAFFSHLDYYISKDVCMFKFAKKN